MRLMMLSLTSAFFLMMAIRSSGCQSQTFSQCANEKAQEAVFVCNNVLKEFDYDEQEHKECEWQHILSECRYKVE